jgi:peptidoglycan/LPS O-acetylase OafA/YrhL
LFWLLLAIVVASWTRRQPHATDAKRPYGTVATLLVLTLAAFSSVWMVSLGTDTYEARLAYVGLPPLACLLALGLERWPVPVRFAFPLLLLVGTLAAIQNDVLTDEKFLHATGSDPSMPKPRFAIENWFLGPSGSPDDTPIAV